MPFFLIPVAVVGYKMWERHVRQEKEREEQQRDGSMIEKIEEHENEEASSPFLTQESIESEASTVNEELITGIDVGTSHDDRKQESGPFASMTRSFFEDEQRTEKNGNGPFNKENLTYEVLETQATNDLPFCYK